MLKMFQCTLIENFTSAFVNVHQATRLSLHSNFTMQTLSLRNKYDYIQIF